MDVRVICFSKGRSRTIGEHTLRLFPDMELLVHESERDDYAGLVPDEKLLTHDCVGFANMMVSFFARFADSNVVFIADDTTDLYALPGWGSRRYNDPEVCMAVVQNAAECANDIGAKLFGFAANANPIVYEPYKPVHLSRWLSNPFGVLANHGLAPDPRLNMMSDLDLSIQTMLKHRILWCDRRWAFVGKALTNSGGSAMTRNPEQFELERKILKEKWGQYVRFDTEAMHSSQRYKDGLPATTMMSYVYVPRTQGAF